MHIKLRFKGYKNNLFDLGAMFTLFSVLATNRQLKKKKVSSTVIVIPSPACLSSRYAGFKALLAMKQLHVILLSWRHVFRLAKFHRRGKASRFISPRTLSAIGTALPCSAINTSSIIVTNNLVLIGFFWAFIKPKHTKKECILNTSKILLSCLFCQSSLAPLVFQEGQN